MFWEHQAGTDDPLDPGVMPLAYAADLTACQSMPGTFHCVNGDKEFSPVGQSRTITVHVHPHGSTDPRSDSKTYCGTARHHCVRVGDRGTVRQVHALRAGNHTGSLCGGFRCLFERCLAYDGVSHEMLMASGEFRDCIAYRGFEDPRRSVIMMEFYTADGRGEACQYTRCVCFVSPDLTGIGTGFGGHTSDNVNKPYASWSHVDCCVRGVAFAANAGQRYHFLRCVAENGWWSVASSGPNAAADLTMSDCAIHWDEATSPRSAPDGIIEIPQAASSTIIDGLRAFATGDLIGSLANVIYVPYANTVSLSRCVISLGPVVSNTFCVAINSLGADVSITESVLDASEDAGGTTRLLKYRPEAVPGGGNNVYFPGHADITIVGDVNTDGSGKAAAETGSVTTDPMIADATLGDFSLGGMGLPLNAGLERPHISFTTVPADLAAAEARLR
jgi:hypothetical protein